MRHAAGWDPQSELLALPLVLFFALPVLQAPGLMRLCLRQGLQAPGLVLFCVQLGWQAPAP